MAIKNRNFFLFKLNVNVGDKRLKRFTFVEGRACCYNILEKSRSLLCKRNSVVKLKWSRLEKSPLKLMFFFVVKCFLKGVKNNALLMLRDSVKIPMTKLT